MDSDSSDYDNFLMRHKWKKGMPIPWDRYAFLCFLEDKKV